MAWLVVASVVAVVLLVLVFFSLKLLEKEFYLEDDLFGFSNFPDTREVDVDVEEIQAQATKLDA